MNAKSDIWLVQRVTLPMAQSSQVEGRMKAILERNRRRSTMAWRMRVLVILAASGLLWPLAALRVVGQAQEAQTVAPKTIGKTARERAKANARVSAVHAVPGEVDAMALERQGMTLSPQAVTKLQKRLDTQPDDLNAHILLLGYGWERSDPAARQLFHAQVFWLIRRHPESVLAAAPYMTLYKQRDGAAAFDQGKALWLDQVAKQPRNTQILANAAQYCTLSDPQTAERLLKQAASVEPRNPKWPEQLGQLYSLALIHASGVERQQTARHALAEYEQAAQLSSKYKGTFLLPNLAKMAYEAGDFDKAQTYAEAMLASAKNNAQDVGHKFFGQGSQERQYGNLILGRLALKNGDIAGAKAHLQAMAEIQVSPGLSSFGPNMQLAQELLQHGERQAVLDYLVECAGFWKNDGGRLHQWIAQIKAGQNPDFGGNLVY